MSERIAVKPGSNNALLDDVQKMRAADAKDMMGLTTGFAAQCREGNQIGSDYHPAYTASRPISHVVVTGLGGSAIGGDLLRSLMESVGDVPLLVNRDYELPSYVGKDTLVLCASYSGGTEETLAAYTAARERGAQIECVTSGGTLAARAAADGVSFCTIPGGQPPRASTGYLFFPLLSILQRRGLLSRSLDPDVKETLDLLDTLRDTYAPSVPTVENTAKQLALALHNRVPVFYGSQGYRGVVAVRWKGQFNENGKQHAFANVFPEQNHNEILAWTLCRRQAPRWSVVFLREPDEKETAPRIARRVEVTRRIIGRAAESHEVFAKGSSLLARMFSLIYLGDFASVYTAYLNQIDPTEIIGIDRLKTELAKLK